MQMLFNLIALTSVAAISCVTSTFADESPKPGAAANRIGKTIDAFSLKDFGGKTWATADFEDKQILVVAFLGTECPLVKLYSPRLQELTKTFQSDSVAFIGINSNTHDSTTEIAAHARRQGLTFPILKDVANRVADQFGAVRTPEVFVLDQERVVQYHGRIDDQYGVGFIRDKPTRNDLEIAVRELINGKKISQPQTVAVGCHIGRIKHPKPNAKVTYSNQIARVFQNRCVECHRDGEIAPFALTDYKEVVGWADMIAEVVDEGRMPPWHANPKHGKFMNDRLLTQIEKSQIFQWVRDGAPQGDPSKLPKPRSYTVGWQLPREPDVVFDFSPQPFRVQAKGAVRYKYFQISPKFTEDKWIQAAELKPGNRAVVHHILAFARTPRSGDRVRGGADGFLVAYVPGMRATTFPAGMAKRFPKNAQIVFQVHYTPIGTEQLDQSQLGLIFADPKTLTHEIRTGSAVERRFQIPPGASNHAVHAQSAPSPQSVIVLGLMPHMHLRGKSFRYEAVFAGGQRQMLLDIPNYDFNWQTSYRLAEPLKFPAGTRIECVAHFDNSEDNLNNPDPRATVRWGDQTWNEMMIGYFDTASAISKDGTVKNEQPSPLQRVQARAIIKRYDKNGNGKVERTEAPARLRRLFDRLDQNDDNVLTEQEVLESIDKLR